jgi:hypothetical protein
MKSRNFLLIVVTLCTLSLVIAGTVHTQVVIQKQDIANVFSPGLSFYSTAGFEGVYNIGKTGGPNVYDFSFITLANPYTANNYAVTALPLLMGRYPSAAFTFGSSPTTIEKNPVFLMTGDTMLVLGNATLTPSVRFKHNVPYDLVAVFPSVYGASFSRTITEYDTTFNPGGSVFSTNTSSSLEVTTVDGWGTLKFAGKEFNCIRIRKDHTAHGDKEFIYMTKEGAILLFGNVSAASPDTGSVHGGGQLLFPTSLTGVDQRRDPLPASFGLAQNYPNPFNPTTTIQFTVADRQSTILKVYDLLGREMATLVNEVKDPGTYSVQFDAARLVSGVYYYRLSSGARVETRQMLLVK